MSSASSSTHLSNHASTAKNILSDLKVKWKEADNDVVRNRSIVFTEQWELFMDALYSLIPPLPADLQPERRGDVAWNFFKPVFEARFGSKRAFSKALLKALRDALGPLVDEDSVPVLSNDETSFKLVNIEAGFAENLKRERMYGEHATSYGATNRNVRGHCFFVYKEWEAPASPILSPLPQQPPPPQQQSTGQQTNQRKRKPPPTVVPEPPYIFDVTALVELKNGTSRCGPFDIEKYDAALCPPDLADTHGPFAQAIVSTLDVWHCLARRGVIAKRLPLAVLGARSTMESSDQSYLYSVDGNLCVPEQCGDIFTYTVTRYVEYGADDSDEMAAAIYIQTLRIGVQQATEIVKGRNAPPVGLVSWSSNVGEANLSLFASPIPYANPFPTQRWSVNQGDLFMFSGQDLSWLSQLPDAISHCASHHVNDPVIVKISCAAVHNCYIPRFKCAQALKTMLVAGVTTNVLLAFRYIDSGNTMITVMRNLSTEGFGPLLHDEILHDPSHLPLLWVAFGVLVSNALLPMAKLGVVHSDVRPSTRETHNILCALQRGEDGSVTAIELRLIDYDSLVPLNLYPDEQNMPAMHISYLPRPRRTTRACTYLFWQVLWLAHVWMTRARGNSNALSPKHFVRDLSKIWRGETIRPTTGTSYELLTNWFSESPTMSRKEENNEVDIVNLLHDLGQVFELDVAREAPYADRQERQQQQQV